MGSGQGWRGRGLTMSGNRASARESVRMKSCGMSTMSCSLSPSSCFSRLRFQSMQRCGKELELPSWPSKSHPWVCRILHGSHPISGEPQPHPNLPFPPHLILSSPSAATSVSLEASPSPRLLWPLQPFPRTPRPPPCPQGPPWAGGAGIPWIRDPNPPARAGCRCAGTHPPGSHRCFSSQRPSTLGTAGDSEGQHGTV